MPVITRSQSAAFRSVLKKFNPAVLKFNEDADFVTQFNLLITRLEDIDGGQTFEATAAADEDAVSNIDITRDWYYITTDLLEYAVNMIINIFGAGSFAAKVLEVQFKAMLRASGRTPLYRKGRVLIEGPYNAPVLRQEKVFLWSGIRKEQEALAADLHLEWDPYM